MRLLPDMPTTLHIQGLEAEKLSKLSHHISLLGKRTESDIKYDIMLVFCLQLFSIFGSTSLLGRLPSTLQKNSHSN